MRKFYLVLICIILSSIEVKPAVDIVVLPDKVLIGPVEFMPRCYTMPVSLVVLQGQVFELPDDSTWDCIEVRDGGILRVSNSHNTIVKFIHLVILPGGLIEGNITSQNVEFIIRNIPIDFSKDPFQWGNCLCNFGRQAISGQVKTRWTNSSVDMPAGLSSFTGINTDGWLVNDELLIPSTNENNTFQKEGIINISSKNSNTIGLSNPLDFNHPNIALPDNTIIKRPYIANVSSNFVIRSENPNGTRGHTVNVGHLASWDIRYIEFRDLGRTKSIPLDDTTIEADGTVNHIGTNQRGKYTAHVHHTHGVGSRYTGNVFKNGLKWALPVHGTNDSIVDWNVAYNFDSGCFVTEDGNEFNNIFDSNFCAYTSFVNGNASEQVSLNCPGCEGSGYWFRGTQNIITNNVSMNNQIGMNLFNQPIAAGVDSFSTKPVLMKGNVSIANHLTGLDYWSQSFFWNEDFLAAHNTSANIFASISSNPNNFPGLKNPLLIGQEGVYQGINSSAVYIAGLIIDGGFISSNNIGIADAGGSELTVKNVTMQNILNIDLKFVPGISSSIENVLHVPYKTNKPRYIEFGNLDTWEPGEPLPGGNDPGGGWFTLRGPFTGSRHRIIRHQRQNGEDFFLYELQQRSTAFIWPTGVPIIHCGMTQGESWNNCGVAYLGDTIFPNEEVTVLGLTQGLARKSSTQRVMGQARAIMSQPNGSIPVGGINNNGTIAYYLLSGDTNAGRNVRVTYEDGTSEDRGADPPFLAFSGAPATVGNHFITVSRINNQGQVVPGSEKKFEYCIPGPCGNQPLVELCGPDGTGNGIDDNNNGLIDEIPPCIPKPSNWVDCPDCKIQSRDNDIRIIRPDGRATNPIPTVVP